MENNKGRDVTEYFTLVIHGPTIKEPLMYSLATKMNVVPNLLKGKITKDSAKIELSLRGTKTNILKAVKYLEDLQIEVKAKNPSHSG